MANCGEVCHVLPCAPKRYTVTGPVRMAEVHNVNSDKVVSTSGILMPTVKHIEEVAECRGAGA